MGRPWGDGKEEEEEEEEENEEEEDTTKETVRRLLAGISTAVLQQLHGRKDSWVTLGKQYL